MAQSAQRKNIASADTETDPFKHGENPEVFLAGFFDGTAHEHEWGPCAAEWLAKRCLRFKGIIYMHNGGNFDFHFLLPFLPLADCDFLMIGKRIVQIKCGDMDLRDSFAIIPKALSSWSKIDIDIQKLHRDRRDKHREEIIRYMTGDNSSLHDMVSEFIARFGLSLTLASTAFKVLRNQFHVPIMRTTSRFDRRLRKHYFAGRVQFTSIGRQVGRFECYDINSAFPNAMQFPHFYSGTYETLPGWPKKFKEQSLYVVECIAGGALAMRQDDGSIEFPLGRGTYHTTGWELLAGMRTGAIRALRIQLCFCPRKVRDFGEFVRHFYEGKATAKRKMQECLKKGDAQGARFWKAEEYFFKIILNAAYGKFGQDVSRYTDVCWTSWRGEDELKGDGWEVVLDDEPRGLTLWERPSPKKPTQKGEFYNVAVAASITGFVRAQVHEAMKKAKRVLYADTDALIAEKVRVPKGDGLGEWKLERVFDVFWCGGKKLYVGHDASAKWHKRKPTWTKKQLVKTRTGKMAPFVFVKGLGWSKRDSFKMASKGVNLPVEDLIDVCEGHDRISRSDPPTYSLKRGTRFITRKVRRVDKRTNHFSGIPPGLTKQPNRYRHDKR
jgi:hypothetical protein